MRIKCLLVAVLTAIFALQGFAQNSTLPPVNLKLVRAGHKIITKRQPVGSADQAVSYKDIKGYYKAKSN